MHFYLKAVVAALGVVLVSGLCFSAIPPNYSAVPFRNVIQQIPGRFFPWRYDSAAVRGISWENPGTDVMTGDYYQYDGRKTAGAEDHIINRILNPAWDVYGDSVFQNPADSADTIADPVSDTTLIYNDMNATKDGIYIGYIDHGEWVKSTVNVAKDGLYQIDLMLTSRTGSPSIAISSLNGTDSISTGTIIFKSTGFYHYYQDEKNMATIRLKKGVQLIRTDITGAGPFNLWFYRFTLIDSSTGAAPTAGELHSRWGEVGATVLHDGTMQLSFSSENNNPVTVTMFNALGKEYGSEILTSVHGGLNTARCRTRLVPGVAFVRLQQGDAFFVKKAAAIGGKR
jgi:Carbohydrate binding module (family 6)